MAGKIYLEAASGVVLSAGAGREGRLALIKRGDPYEIDECANVSRLLGAAADRAATLLKEANVPLPAHFKRIVLASDSPEKDLAVTINYLSSNKLDNKRTGRFIYEILAAVHEAWATARTARLEFFSDPGKEYRFLAPPLVGYVELMRLYGVVRPLIATLGIDPTGIKVAMAYNNARWKYAYTYRLHSETALVEHIQSCEGRIKLPASILLAMMEPATAQKIAKQVLAINPELI